MTELEWISALGRFLDHFLEDLGHPTEGVFEGCYGEFGFGVVGSEEDFPGG